MTYHRRHIKKRSAGALAAFVAAIALVFATPGPALAASAVAHRDNFQTQCDAVVVVSDETSYGNVEVYGGFSCPTGTGLFVGPEPTTIMVSIWRNGTEIRKSTRISPVCIQGHWTCSTDSWQVTYPDDSPTDRFKGKMVIMSMGGSVTLTTGEIST